MLFLEDYWSEDLDRKLCSLQNQNEGEWTKAKQSVADYLNGKRVYSAYMNLLVEIAAVD
jgi:hypothetical protein